MSHAVYEKLQNSALKLARSLPRPLFYGDHEHHVRQAEEALIKHEFIRECRAYLDESQMECAHGLCHCEAVARDAGTIVLIEAGQRGYNQTDIDTLFFVSIIAGLLHDIKRKEDDHAVRGSIEAEKILTKLGMGLRERQFIADAIRNHEAFQETFERDDEAGQLVSNALYDADKFRWGPENFSMTLWTMVIARNTPLESLHRTFREKMSGIARIKETFRTPTGKRYGPEFIDQGILIGNAIFEELSIELNHNK